MSLTDGSTACVHTTESDPNIYTKCVTYCYIIEIRPNECMDNYGQLSLASYLSQLALPVMTEL